jgi:predicted dehydrogenase
MNIGVIGAGWWGKNIINSFEEVEAVQKVFYFDSNPEVTEKFKTNKKSFLKNSIDDLLLDPSIEAVCIATPPATHYELTKNALLTNNHVLVEKPPAFTFEEVHELGLIAKSKNLVYMLDALYLFLPPVVKLKEILESGELNQIRYIDMYRIGDELRREGAGIQRIQNTMFNNHTDVIEDLFFHDAGILIYLFQHLEILSIKKHYFYNDILCDSAEITFKRGNIPIHLKLSWVLTGRRRGISIYDTKYILEYDGLKQDNQLIKYNLWQNNAEYFSFPSPPPLKSLLSFFIDAITLNKKNYMDHTFMEKITKFWGEIKNAK